MDPLRDAQNDLAVLTDGEWNRKDAYAIADLLTKLALLVTLAAPTLCAVQPDSEPAAEADSEGSSG